ncbi:MAG: hypothetical protein GY910_15890 [bacterium]|nr:hypothetical protein [bacterium]
MSSFESSEKVAIVTDAGQHGGLALASALAERDATTAVDDLVGERAQRAAAEAASSGGVYRNVRRRKP